MNRGKDLFGKLQKKIQTLLVFIWRIEWKTCLIKGVSLSSETDIKIEN